MDFKIKLSPIASDHDTTIMVDNDTITWEGNNPMDFSVIPTGGDAEGVYPAIGRVYNNNDTIELTLAYCYDVSTASAIQPIDEAHYMVEITSGQVPDVIIREED